MIGVIGGVVVFAVGWWVCTWPLAMGAGAAIGVAGISAGLALAIFVRWAATAAKPAPRPSSPPVFTLRPPTSAPLRRPGGRLEVVDRLRPSSGDSKGTDAREDTVARTEQVATDTRSALGDDHPDTFQALNNLAGAYQVAGLLDRATELFEHVLDGRRRVQGVDHPDTITAMINLGGAHHVAERLDEAIALFESALTTARRVLGPDHLETLNAGNALAHAYQANGQRDEALSLFEQTLADRRRIFGDDHDEVLDAANGLAAIHLTAGRPEEAVTLLAPTLIDSRRSRGDDDPRTLVTANNLAHAYEEIDEVDEALTLFERTAATAQRVLGREHPLTGRVLDAVTRLRAAGRLTDVQREVARLDAVLEPIVNRRVDVSTPERFMAMIEAGPPRVDAAVNAECTTVLEELLVRYASGDEATRVATRDLFTRYPSFRWAAHLPWEPTAESFRLHLLHLSAKDQGGDMRDEIVTLDSYCAKAREAGIDVGPILHQVAELSSDVNKYGMGSIRGLLLSRARA
ncbi:tetratricopeptide repeat protein [Actinosynnema sp. NPDC051121]